MKNYLICFIILQKITKESLTTKSKSIKPPTRLSQKSILAGAVRKRVAVDTTDGINNKSKDDNVPAKRSKVENCTSSTAESNGKSDENGDSSSNKLDLSVHNKGSLVCIGILPGIGKYKDSSDSEKSTDTDEEYDFSDFDWVGRKVKRNDCDD